jgi:hypothetical protein
MWNFKLKKHSKTPQSGYWTGPLGEPFGRKGTLYFGKLFRCMCKKKLAKRLSMKHLKNGLQSSSSKDKPAPAQKKYYYCCPTWTSKKPNASCKLFHWANDDTDEELKKFQDSGSPGDPIPFAEAFPRSKVHVLIPRPKAPEAKPKAKPGGQNTKPDAMQKKTQKKEKNTRKEKDTSTTPQVRQQQQLAEVRQKQQQAYNKFTKPLGPGSTSTKDLDAGRRNQPGSIATKLEVESIGNKSPAPVLPTIAEYNEIIERGLPQVAAMLNEQDPFVPPRGFVVDVEESQESTKYVMDSQEEQTAREGNTP